MRKLVLAAVLALSLAGCNNYWYAGTVLAPAAGLLKAVDIGVTTSDSFTYRIDVCALSPYIGLFHSGPFDWSGYAWGIMDGKLAAGEPISCRYPCAAT